jgi:hypothetical protein
MSRRVAQRARAERASFDGQARDIPWPLPLGGLFDEAKRSEVSGQIAETLHNFQSNGVGIEMRDDYSEQDSEVCLQRIPFEFGETAHYVKIFANRAETDEDTFSRNFTGNASYTDISSNVLIADGDGPIVRYDGNGFSSSGFVTDSGKNPDAFDGIHSHQDRVYAWDTRELAFFYGGVGAVTGTLTRFPLDRLGNISGTVTCITSMTINAAHGMNDVLVIVTSTGWIVLYEGLDPGDSTDWRLLGRVKVAKPVARDALEQFGSDLWLLTVRGLVSLRESLANEKMALVSSAGKAISDLIVKDIRAGMGLPGWEMITRQDGEEILINIPVPGGTFKQYVYELSAPSWSTADYPSMHWHDLGGWTEFNGTDGKLYRLASGGDDHPITATWHSAWVRLPNYGEIAYLIPTIIANGELTVKITVLTDHNQTADDIAQAQQTVTLRPDNPGDEVSLDDLFGINAAGRVFQLRLELTGNNVSIESMIAGVL